MRFNISLYPEKKYINLPYNYNYHLASAIYSFLDEAEPYFSTFLHDEGYSHGERVFKLFTFSPLLASQRRTNKSGLILEGKINWLISSPKKEFLLNLVNGIFARGFLLICGHKLIVEGIEVLSTPSFENKVSFKTLSPIVVSTGEITKEGNLTKKYLSPFDSRFYRNLEENLRRKYYACYGMKPPDDGITIEFDQDFISKRRVSKLIDFKGIKIRGYVAPFTARGNPELIRIGYEAGFGENNSAGFGLVEVVK